MSVDGIPRYPCAMKTYHIQQRITPIVNRYHVYAGDDAGNQGLLIAFAEQKRLALREKITLFTDESRSNVTFTIQARTVFDLGARYDIIDGDGKQLAVIGKAFGASLLKSTWNIYAPGAEEQPAIIVTERNLTIALVRRLWDFIPFAEMIPIPFRFNFDFRSGRSDTIVATYDKLTVVRDNYRLDISDPAGLNDDVFIAMGIMLDALQGR